MSPGIVGVFIPIIAIIAGIAVAIVGMVAQHRQRLQRADLRHRERLAAIDKGLELPPDPPDVDPRAADEARFLRHGLVLVAVGATVTAALMQLPDKDIPWLFGFIPASIGIAYLLYFVIRLRLAPSATRPAPGPDRS